MRRGIESGYDGVLILRSDLSFISNLCVKNFSKYKILFQWNLLHNKYTLEVPDQIHFIGSIPLKKLYKASIKNVNKLVIINSDIFVESLNELRHISTCEIDKYWAGTLHYLLRFCLLNLEINQIGFINYIEDPNIKKVISEIRGDSNSKEGNPLYTW